MKRLLSLIAFAVALTVVVGCSGTDCKLNNTSYVYMYFYGEDGNSVSLESTITVVAPGTDSIFINQESGASYMQLPLCYTNDVDTFIIQYTDLLIDSVFVEHTNIQHFISMECSLAMYYYINDVWSTNNAIDSIRVVQRDIDFDEAEHVKIYFMDGV